MKTNEGLFLFWGEKLDLKYFITDDPAYIQYVQYLL